MDQERRYGCRWCAERYQYFHDLVEHADETHPFEFERAITARPLSLVPAPGAGGTGHGEVRG